MTLASISHTSNHILNDLDQCATELDRLITSSKLFAYNEVANIANWCKQNLLLFKQGHNNNTKDFLSSGESWAWIELIHAVLNEPKEISHLSTLSSELTRSEWVEPLDIEELQSLLLSLRSPDKQEMGNNETPEEKPDTKSTSTKNTDDDNEKLPQHPTIKLSWDDDIHPELLEAYFEETPELVQKISQFLKTFSNEKFDKEERHTASRLAHTIKGGSAVLGITGLADIAYSLEKILDYSVNNELSADTIALLGKASETLETVFNTVQNKQNVPNDIEIIITELQQCSDALENDEDLDMELSAPAMPDFITDLNDSTNLDNNDSTLNNGSSTINMDADVDGHKTVEQIEAEVLQNLSGDTLDDKTGTIHETIEDIEASISTDAINSNNSLIDEVSDKSIEDIESEPVENINSENLIIDTTSSQEGFETEKKAECYPLTMELMESDSTDFCAELDDITMSLIAINNQSDSSNSNIIDNFTEKVDAYTAELERLELLAEISGYKEISAISQWCQTNLLLFSQEDSHANLNYIVSSEAWSWIELISAIILEPEELSHLSALNAALTDENWIEPLPINTLQSLLLRLRSPESTTEDNNATKETENTKETKLTSDIDLVVNEKQAETTTLGKNDTSLKPENTENEVSTDEFISWDDDIHPELLAVYLQETPDQVADVAALLHRIAKGKADKDDHKQAARIAHTIKGASGVLGISTLVDLTHKLEDILDYSVDHDLPEQISELLAESSDCLESLFENIQNKEAPPKEFAPVLAKLTKSAESLNLDEIDLENLNLEAPDLPEFIRHSESKNAQTDTSIDNSSSDKKEKTTHKKVNKTASNTNNPVSEAHIRVPVSVIDKLLNLAGELVTTSSQVSDKIGKTLQTQATIKEQDTRIHKMLSELTETIDQQEKDQTNLLSSLKESDFDTLEMDTYNELHSIVGLLTESILDSETIETTVGHQLGELSDHLRTLDQLNKELSEAILSSRMVSVDSLVPRLERIVRETCRKTGKKAELIISGNQINIDTDIINGLVDPLLHLLRNAIDHGLESPQQRQDNNKDETGKICLDFKRKGNFVEMKLSDDGKGIDPEFIYQRAIEKGLITPDQEYSRQDVLKLILKAGFTTQDQVSDISGRGVGMDVVKSAIELLNGSLNIHSEIGEGTSFTIKIPLTLVTSATLLVKAGGNQVAIPTDSIEQLYYLSPEEVIQRDNQYFFIYEKNEILIQSLTSLLNWQKGEINYSQAQTLLLVKSNDNELSAIHIEQMMNSKEVVIKSLSPWIDSSKGVVGACHLPDGSVAPVLNLPLIIMQHNNKNLSDTDVDPHHVETDKQTDEAYESTEIPTILVVDDSLSNRKALSLIIEQTDYKVVTAVDGLDALNLMNEQPISLVFTDLEMPRMNGLDLTQSIRAWKANKDIPIVMITSRTTSKHRQLAEKAGVNDYLTKPVVTETLLESIEQWINHKVTAFT